MKIPRLWNLLKGRALGRMLVLYGKGVDDEFLADDYTSHDISRSLLPFFKEEGYQRVLFYDLQQGIHFFDDESVRLSQQRPGRAPLRRSPARGVLGSPQLRRTKQEPIGTAQPSGVQAPVTDERSFSYINTYMRDSTVPTAVVFLRTELVFSHNEMKRQLFENASAWCSLIDPNRNICCWVFSSDNLDDVYSSLTNFPALETHIKRNTAVISNKYIGGPDKYEIRMLLETMRLHGDVHYEWDKIDKLTELFSARNFLLGDWRKLFMKKNITEELAKKEKWIETALSDKSAEERLDELIGLGEVKQKLKEFKATVLMERKRSKSNDLTLNMIFQGNPGTGKTTVARLVGELFREIGLLRRGQCVEVSSLADITADVVGGTAPKVNRKVDEALDGVLFIDEAYQLADEENPFAREALNTLLTRMENDRDRLAVIFAGYPDAMQQFLKANDGLTRRVPTIVNFEDYNPEELYVILRSMLKAHLDPPVTPDMEKCLHQTVQGMYDKRDANFGNAGAMRILRDALETKWSVKCNEAHNDNLPLDRDDLPEEYKEWQSIGERAKQEDCGTEAILQEFNKYVGLQSIKKNLETKVHVMKLNKKLGTDMYPTLHMLFLGAPGTGKTTVAKIIARLYYSMGYLDKPKCISAVPSDVIGAYIGETEKKAEILLNKALGGVLFLDEAYGYVKSEFGQNFVDNSLVPFMEDNRHRIAVIAAGYPEEMQKFLQMNAGLSSRFKSEILFPNYTPEELAEIVGRLSKDHNVSYSDDVRKKVVAYMRIESKKPGFANGRTARNLFDDMWGRLADRVQSQLNTPGNEKVLRTFIPDDVPDNGESARPEDFGTDEILREFDKYVGLQSVKENLETKVNAMKLNKKRGIVVSPTLHMLFLGAPGTGKTTVAQIIARLYYSMGYLDKPTCTTAVPSDIIGAYVGETEKKAKTIFEKARGGVLFLDEAYGYVKSDFGHNFVDNSLITFMETNRNNTAVIAAGYPEEMREFLQMNDGLSSRFKTEIPFPNYTPEELAEIVGRLSKDKNLSYPDDVRKKVVAYMCIESKKPDFANGRTARNLFDDMYGRLANRVQSQLDTGNDSVLSTFIPEDVPDSRP